MVAKGSIAGRRRLAVPELVPIASSTDTPAIACNKIITTIGSKSGVDVRIASKHISGAHALLINIDNNVYICDLISRTGVFVNDKRVRLARLLFGDLVRLGNCRYRFSDEGVLRKSAHALENGRTALLQSSTGSATIDSVAFIIGRRAGAGLVIDSNLVSSAHAILIRAPDKWIIADLHSRTGTTVNGRQIQVTSIRSGDSIRIGSSDLSFAEQEIDASADSSMYGQPAASLVEGSIKDESDEIEAAPPEDVPRAEVADVESAAAGEENKTELAAELLAEEPIAEQVTPELRTQVGLHEKLMHVISDPLFTSPREETASDEPVPASPVPAVAESAVEAPSPVVEQAQAPLVRPTKNKQPARRENGARRPARPQRPQNPSINNNGERHKWGPLATAVADPKLLELVAVSRRRQMPTHRLAPVRTAPQKMLPQPSDAHAASAPGRRQRLALAGAVAAAIAIVSGAAWYVISHPNLVAQLW